MKEKIYNRKKVVQYAKRWAYDRNPKYYNNANDKSASWTGVEYLYI